MVYSCAVSGATPLNTTNERQHALKSNGASTLSDMAASQKLNMKQVHDQLVTQTIRVLCESEHRLDYLSAVSSASQAILQGRCRDIADGKQVELAVQQIKRAVQAKSGAEPHPSLAAEHPFRSYRSAAWYEQGADNFWTRRRRATKHNGRDDWKISKCAGESFTDFDAMFSSYVHNGCSSPVALGWKNVITPACFSHDMCYDCAYEFEGNGWQCDLRLHRDIKNECSRKTSWYETPLCKVQADAMFLAVAGWGRIKKEMHWWCDSACAKSTWQTQTEATFRALDPWYG